jgi:NAD(P)-dependent dehydrogenase (short-subunit alcohol dehydrogenase family)
MAAIDVTLSDPEAFAGRTAIITGGCRGIGLVTARLMHSLGCNVVLGDLRPPPQTQEWTNTRSACYQKCDITNWDSVKALFERAKSEFGSIDIVCANAGINDLGDAFFSNELVDKDGTLKEPNLTTLDVNIKGTTYTVILGIHYLKANKRGGSIILTASLSGYFPTMGMPLYSASKHGKTST